jgi:hypothetical protein
VIRGSDSKLFKLKRILYNGDFIFISRRNIELVRALAGIMLVAYVSGMILVLELGAKGIIDAATVHALQMTLDVPTFLVMVVFSGLSIRLELFKPKYKLPTKKRPLYDGILMVASIIIIVAMILLKYG